MQYLYGDLAIISPTIISEDTRCVCFLYNKPLSEGWTSRVSLELLVLFEFIVGEIIVESPYEIWCQIIGILYYMRHESHIMMKIMLWISYYDEYHVSHETWVSYYDITWDMSLVLWWISHETWDMFELIVVSDYSNNNNNNNSNNIGIIQ